MSGHQLFRARAMIWFMVMAEMLSMLEPEKVRVPIKKVTENCNFRVFICPCGFYAMYENNLKSHLRYYHSLSKEIVKKFQRGIWPKALI